MDSKNKSFFFIGISGIGMSALAAFLHKNSNMVAGSCDKKTLLTDELEKIGIEVFLDNQTDELANKRYDFIVTSTAIKTDNPMLALAKSLGMHIVHRAQLLGMIAKEHTPICVTGCHGKTTTSSLIFSAFLTAGIEVGALIGGVVKMINSNWAVPNKTDLLVFEGDESDKSLVNLPYNVGIITNIEMDHVDHYKNEEEMLSLYAQFAHNFMGNNPVLLLCADDKKTMEELVPLIKHLPVAIKTFGRDEKADYKMLNLENNKSGLKMQVLLSESQQLVDVAFPLHGAHNAYNACVAIATMHQKGIPLSIAVEAIKMFDGTERRFSVLHNQIANGGIALIDDYAHHPTEVKSLIEACDFFLKDQQSRLVFVFEPHRLTRLAYFMNDFASILAKRFSFKDKSCKLFLIEPYFAGDKKIDGATSEVLARRILSFGGEAEVISLKTFGEVIKKYHQPRDCWVCVGAGDLSAVTRGLKLDFL